MQLIPNIQNVGRESKKSNKKDNKKEGAFFVS
jgi:hypothetical protein